MREAMASAEVDDDILGYDPTARHLEEEMAKMMGKEAALFVPSGTMGNLICVMVHCEVRGSEVILGDNSHIHVYENGGISTMNPRKSLPLLLRFLPKPTQILILTIKVDLIFNQMQNQLKGVIKILYNLYDQTKNQKVIYNSVLCKSTCNNESLHIFRRQYKFTS
ncbi:BnaC07g03750D [Brassica napus]|uniref:BnaC07g03750D protein n=1 Tax=Brassica napus TaxID=3708 RepID=A0A078GIX3_BRANA|nr:BnaC07g03750D [Brassica napus]